MPTVVPIVIGVHLVRYINSNAIAFREWGHLILNVVESSKKLVQVTVSPLGVFGVGISTGPMADRICDACGETFGTLSRLRLHDCPGEGIVDDAFLPEPQPDKLPNRVLEKNEFDELKNDSRVERIENMMDVPLPGKSEAISFVVQIDGQTYGLHCDHDTSDWDIVAEGRDWNEVKRSHREWLSEDIGEVTGGAPDPDNLDGAEVPEQITTDCNMCDGEHELTAQPDSFTSAMGFLEYEGFCEESGQPIITTKNPDEVLEQ